MFASLRFRLILILLAAAVPAVAVSSLLAYSGFKSNQAARLAALSRETDILASRLDAATANAARIALVLAALPAAEESGTDCRAMAGALQDRTYPAIAIFKSGKLACHAGEDAFLPRQDNLAAAARMVASDHTRLWIEAQSAQAATIWAMARGREARADHVAAVMMNRSSLLEALELFRSTPSSRAVLAESSGTILLASERAAAPLWQEGQIKLLDGPALFTNTSPAGQATTHTAQKLSGFADVWLVTSQKDSDITKDARRHFLLATAEPLLFLTVALVAIWFGLNREVLRWLSRLRTVAAAYTKGNLSTRTKIAQGPREFTDLSRAFDDLADRIAERTRDLEQEVAAKSQYIRELHHRVKNNLQIIGSLLSLQSREVSPEARETLRFPMDRVNAMSAAYRASYAEPEGIQASIESVLREVAQRLQSNAGPGGLIDLHLIGGELQIHLDDAITLAMLLAELLPAFVNAGVKAEKPIELTLAASPERLEIRIRGPEVNRQSLQLSRRFIQAYLKLLGATLDERWEDETRIEGPFPKGKGQEMGKNP